MSGPSQDWILIVVFFGAFLLVTIGEIYWLSQRLTVPIKKALTTVFLSNFLTITLGFLVAFIGFGLLLGTVSNDDTAMGPGARALFVAPMLFPILLMVATRRFLVTGMRIEQIARPLQYAIVSTLIFFAAVFGLPAIFLTFR